MSKELHEDSRGDSFFDAGYTKGVAQDVRGYRLGDGGAVGNLFDDTLDSSFGKGDRVPDYKLIL